MIKTIYGPVIALCLLFTACATVKKPAADPGLYIAANELPVKIKDGWLTAKTLTLGAYTTSSRTNGVAANTPAKQFKSTSDAFYFTVKGQDAELPVQVLSTGKITFSNRPLPAYLNTLPGDAPLWYIFAGGTAQDPLKSWELLLKKNIAFLELNDNKPVGILRSSTDEIRITAHNRYGIRNSTEKICYEFQLKGVPVAAVVTGENPRAWIHSKADANLQRTLAAIMLGLLFKS
ncbi:hypothetical protein [Chitinophaga barathri]|uniref:Uncharacterized protein n=1 Tax=Chitinophaga barathri TaxID=1647451 RepID=A0A3N4M5I4_9BACT|nr:hypothetical protein [Chitinophaga barathri]RPD38482.1 hypothetical protein EG028_24755 [Chitinophaga barathri]